MSHPSKDGGDEEGILEEILSLVAPPVSDEAQKKEREKKRVQKRRERDQAAAGSTKGYLNHDYCDACKEGGDLLCCDRCPAAFHLLCHDPPLEDADIPPGEWICRRCKVTLQFAALPDESCDSENDETTSIYSTDSQAAKQMLKKISSNLLRAAMRRKRAKSQSECTSSSSLRGSSNMSTSKSSEDLAEASSKFKQSSGTTSLPPVKRGRGRPPKNSNSEITPTKEEKERPELKESPTAASMGHAIVVLDDIANDSRNRYDALLFDSTKKEDVDSLSTCSTATSTATRRPRGRPPRQINFDNQPEECPAALQQQISAMTNAEELPSLDEEWALIKRVTRLAEGPVECSEDDPYEAPVSVSSDGSWRPEGERKSKKTEESRLALKLFPKHKKAKDEKLESMDFDLDDLKDAETLNEKRSSLSAASSVANTTAASIVEEDDQDLTTRLHPMRLLAKAAEMLNPMQYELPKELQTLFVIPGTSKRKWRTDGRRWIEITPKQKQVIEAKSGIVLPSSSSSFCFVCSRSCRQALLLRCDFCPLLFHLDCLDPPLTSVPVGSRWMCPNHPEHIVDQRLLPTEFGISERMVLWEKHAPKDISESAVKLGFLRKVHRTDPPYRLKRKVDLRKGKKVIVPSSIKAHYRYPPKALPQSLVAHHSALRIEDGNEGRRTAMAMEKKQQKMVEDKEKWLREMISNQVKGNASTTTIAYTTSQDALDEAPEDAETKNSGKEVVTRSQVKEPELASSITKIPTEKNESVSSTEVKTAPSTEAEGIVLESNADEAYDCFKDLPSLVPINDLNLEHKDVTGETQKGICCGDNKTLTEDISCGAVLKKVSPDKPLVDVVDKVGVQAESSSGRVCTSFTAQSSSTTNIPFCHINRASLKPSAVVATTELDLAMRLNALDRHLVEYLALDRLRELMVPHKDQKEEVDEEENFKRRSRRNFEERRPVTYPTDRVPIALFSVCEFDDPLSSTYDDDDVFPMFSNTFSVGTNDDCDFVLSDYVDPRSPCYARFSPRHLVVFFDKYAGLFELLNYGAEGVVVDNVYYGFDVDANRNRKDKWNGGVSGKGISTVQDVEVKEGRGRGRKRKDTRAKKDLNSALASLKKGGKNKETLVSKREEEKTINRCCQCGRSLPTAGQTTNGWEGSAVIYHGSVIQIGCFTLVFSSFES